MIKRFAMLVCLFLLAAMISGCGISKKPAEKATWYLAEYTNELAFPGGTTQRIVYTYDDQWRMSTLKSYFNDDPAADMTYTYSNDNTVVTSKDSVSGLTSEVHRSFDHQGNIIKMEEYDNGTKTGVAYNEYNEKNQLISQISTYFDHPLLQKIEYRYTYDSQGNELEENQEMTYTDGTISTSRTVSQYDSRNRLTEVSQYTGDTLSYTYLYTYDDTANTQTRTTTEANSGKLVYTYDDHGNLLTLEAFGPDGTLQYTQRYRYISTDGKESSALAE